MNKYFIIAIALFIIGYAISCQASVLGNDNAPTQKVHAVDMGEQVVGPSGYVRLVDKLRQADEDDTFVFYLHNYGGSVHGLAYLMNALEETKAKTIAIVDGPTYSAGAVFACGMDEVQIRRHAYLMYHGWSVGSLSGKGSDVLSTINAVNKLTRSMDEKCIEKGLLTKEQVDRIYAGEEIYIYPKDLSDDN